MKVYLTYFRYDRGEEYSIYNLDTNLKRSWKSLKESDLPNFLGYGPDDVSQLYLVRCELTKSEVEVLKDSMTSSEGYDKKFYDLMKKIDRESEELWNTTGDESWSVVEFVCEYCRTFVLFDEMSPYYSTLDFDDEDELKEQIQEIIFDNDDLWDKILKKYIKMYYR